MECGKLILLKYVVIDDKYRYLDDFGKYKVKILKWVSFLDSIFVILRVLYGFK